MQPQSSPSFTPILPFTFYFAISIRMAVCFYQAQYLIVIGWSQSSKQAGSAMSACLVVLFCHDFVIHSVTSLLHLLYSKLRVLNTEHVWAHKYTFIYVINARVRRLFAKSPEIPPPSAEKPREACFDPGNIMNASRTGYDYKLGSQVSYSCHHGYIIVGGDTITCVMGHDGKPIWDKPLPSCKGKINMCLELCLNSLENISTHINCSTNGFQGFQSGVHLVLMWGPRCTERCVSPQHIRHLCCVSIKCWNTLDQELWMHIYPPIVNCLRCCT